MMEYKGYIGEVEFDIEAEIFHGEVTNTRDVITFQSESAKELAKAFRDSVDDYLAFCKERGETPDKPFSGRFMTRIPPELHRQVNVAAVLAGTSLNAFVAEQLRVAVEKIGVIKEAVKKAPSTASVKKAKRKTEKKTSVLPKKSRKKAPGNMPNRGCETLDSVCFRRVVWLAAM